MGPNDPGGPPWWLPPGLIPKIFDWLFGDDDRGGQRPPSNCPYIDCNRPPPPPPPQPIVLPPPVIIGPPPPPPEPVTPEPPWEREPPSLAEIGVISWYVLGDAFDVSSTDATRFERARVAFDTLAWIEQHRDTIVEGASLAMAARGAVIGKLSDLPSGVRPGEWTLLKHLPNRGNPRANWRQNSSVLRIEMRKGLPIRDASVDPVTGTLRNDTGFLKLERNLLRNHGWTYDPATRSWYPPRR